MSCGVVAVSKQTESVRIDAKVLADARIAAAYVGKAVGEYISDIVRPAAARDIDEHHERRAKPQNPKPKR